MLTTGLKCAPDTGPNMRMRLGVGGVLERRGKGWLRAENWGFGRTVPAVSQLGSSETGSQCVEPAGYESVPDPQSALLALDEAGVDEDLHVVADGGL